MYCKYSRESSEMYCILKRVRDIKICWNIKEDMETCKYFVEVSKAEWLDIQNQDDDKFLKEEYLIT
jgi:hypothetical protein